jgi:hypothetical protein
VVANRARPVRSACLNNQFKHLEKVAWRLRIRDQNGKALDGSGLKSLVIELPDGQKVNAQYGPYPGPTNPTDFFWTAIWIIPSLQVVPREIEIKKP